MRGFVRGTVTGDITGDCGAGAEELRGTCGGGAGAASEREARSARSMRGVRCMRGQATPAAQKPRRNAWHTRAPGSSLTCRYPHSALLHRPCRCRQPLLPKYTHAAASTPPEQSLAVLLFRLVECPGAQASLASAQCADTTTCVAAQALPSPSVFPSPSCHPCCPGPPLICLCHTHKP